MDVVQADNAIDALTQLENHAIDGIICGVAPEDFPIDEFVRLVREDRPGIPLVLVGEPERPRALYRALSQGAVDYVESQVSTETPADRIERAVARRRAGEALDYHTQLKSLLWEVARNLPDTTSRREIEEAGSHARQRAGRKLRWPVSRVVVDAEDAATVDALADHEDLLGERLNARAVELVPPGEAWDELAYSADADMSVLGPAFGDEASDVMQALNDATVDAPDLDDLEAAVSDTLGRAVELTDDMVAFVEVLPDAVASAEFDGGTVYVDTTLTDEIEAEGYAREVIRRVQEMRKELDLDVERRIRLEVEVFDERIGGLVAEHEALIAEEVRAAELGAVDDGHEREWDVDGVTMRFAIETLAETTA
jgi:CheY-like chemotaxis protein